MLNALCNFLISQYNPWGRYLISILQIEIEPRFVGFRVVLSATLCRAWHLSWTHSRISENMYQLCWSETIVSWLVLGRAYGSGRRGRKSIDSCVLLGHRHALSAWALVVLTAASVGAGLSGTSALGSQAANWHSEHPSLHQADNWCSALWASRATATCVMHDSHSFIATEYDA